jgi:serine/threonine-protein kinase
MLLQRYRIEKILGQGGMGEVLLAHDTLLHRRVALKRLRPDAVQGGAARGSILREARRASAINDPRIAAIYDVLEVENDVVIVMEYVAGSTLRERMKQPMSLDEFWNLSTQCVEAVAAAHAHGLIHRDIKPDNLMVTGDGQIKILDFGIAKRAEADPPNPSHTVATTTAEAAGTLAGTPQYMAPEALYGGKIDIRTDIFSLGAVFYEMLTARQPFAASSYEAILDRVMNATPEPLTQWNPGAGSALSDVVTKMLAKDPALRHGSCAEVMEDLGRVRELGPAPHLAPASTPSAATPRVRRARRTTWAIATGGLLAAVAAAIFSSATSLPALPRDRNLAVLAPVTPASGEDFAAFALGSVERLSAWLQSHQQTPGFQVASFQEGWDEQVRSPRDARQVLGANLALTATLEQHTDTFHARLDLWDTIREKIIRSRSVEAPAAQPFVFLDRIDRDAAAMLGLKTLQDPRSMSDVRGAGTLRFLMQGIGRSVSAANGDQERRAVADLEIASRTEPEASTAHAWLAAGELKAYKLSGDRTALERARVAAVRAVSLDSARPEPHRVLGAVLASELDSRGSLHELEKACRLVPTDDETWVRWGRTYGRLGEPEREREVYRQVIAARPHCWQPHWWLAASWFRDGHPDEAIDAYEQMIRRSPELYRGYANLGGLLVLRGDYGRAIDTLQRSIALRPTKTAFDNLGTAYFNSGRLEDAVAAYNQSFQFGSADYQTWLNLGDAYYWLRNRRDQARDAYTQAVRLGRDESRARALAGRSFAVMIPANLATVFPKLGQIDSARVFLGMALRADSANSMVQYCAALTYWQLNERERAVVWLRKAVDGGYPIAWLRDSPIFLEWREVDGFRALVASATPELPPVAPSNEGGRR